MRIVLTALFFILPLCLAKAGDPDRSFTYDFGTSGAGQELPSWMSGEPVASPSAHATISFPITPPADDSDLAVTVYFTETEGGFLRVYWAGARDSEMLSNNLFEGIGMPNQRTLLIKRATLSSQGTVNLQSSEPALNIARIHWEWVEPSPVSLAGAAKQTALVNATGGVLGDGEVNGAPLLAKPDQVVNSVVTASLTDKPERIESVVEFVATLQQAPGYARLEVQMAGVPTGKSVKLWINKASAGDVALAVPDLNDPGYQAASGTAPPVYFGWRKGDIYLPAGLLKTGENQFQFTVQDATGSTPLAVKDLLLQLNYENTPADATPSADATSGAPDAMAVPVPDPIPDAPDAKPPASDVTPPASGATPPASNAKPPASGATPYVPITIPSATDTMPAAPDATPPATDAMPPAPDATPSAALSQSMPPADASGTNAGGG